MRIPKHTRESLRDSLDSCVTYEDWARMFDAAPTMVAIIADAGDLEKQVEELQDALEEEQRARAEEEEDEFDEDAAEAARAAEMVGLSDRNARLEAALDKLTRLALLINIHDSGVLALCTYAQSVRRDIL